MVCSEIPKLGFQPIGFTGYCHTQKCRVCFLLNDDSPVIEIKELQCNFAKRCIFLW